MSKSEKASSKNKHPEGSNVDSTKSSGSRGKADSELSSSSVSSKLKFSNEKPHTDNDLLSASQARISRKDDHEEVYHNQLSINNSQRKKANLDSSSEDDSLAKWAPTDEFDWKCRECGYLNEGRDTKCDTCQTPKPMQPRLEARSNYKERSLSPSPSDRRSSSPEEEEEYMDRRRDSQSSSVIHKLHSARKQPSSEGKISEKEKSTQRYSHYLGGRRDSSSSSSSDDNYYHRVKNTTKRRQASEDSSDERSRSRRFTSPDMHDEAPLKGNSIYTKTKIIPHASSNDDQSHNYDKADDRHYCKSRPSTPPPDYGSCIASNGKISSHRQAGSSGGKSPGLPTASPALSEKDKKNVRDLRNDSKPHESRSSSPRKDDRQEKESSLYKESDDRSTAAIKRQTASQVSSRTSSEPSSTIVYVPDLPPNIKKNEALENKIRQCLETKHKHKVVDVKCNTQLGIGIVYVYSVEDKKHLTDTLEKIILDTSSNTTVSFVSELNLVSYVVIDTKDMKDLPSADDICRRWLQLYKVHSKPRCKQLSIQFPNIFRIVTHSLAELIESISIKEFLIYSHFASVYFRADCCFLEDLPRTTTLDRLREAINKQISEKTVSKELIHVQYNKDVANAVVLTSGEARIWSLHNSVTLDGRVIMKKDSLSCRLLIRNVPKDISSLFIQAHRIFDNSITKITRGSDHVIVELSDRKVYERCIDQGALRINDHPLCIEVYAFSSNPEDSDIDAENWYETEMCDHKPDITPFLSNLEQPIFRMRWNSKAFLEQLHKWTLKDRSGMNEKDREKHEKLCNKQRHLLRITVMLNTIGIIKRGSYRVNEKEIKLKPGRLKTILYDHKSTLQRGRTTSLSDATQFPYESTLVKVVDEDCLIVYKDLVKKGFRPVLLNMANAHNPGGGYKRGDGAQEETLFRRSNYFQSLDLELDNEQPTARFYCDSNCNLGPILDDQELYPMDEFGAIYTSGLTVFRHPEDTGYDFMDIPMYDVCAIAMAAYREPKVENHTLAPKYSIGTRKKIENIFAIAYHHKHDCLVLSALGCGAFRNPPAHVATIFKSVIEQYAGFFKLIYFAIVDDHNAGQNFNPAGNYRPFKKLLDNLEVEPKKSKIPNMMIGPRRMLNQKNAREVTLSDIKICYLNPCHHGGKCHDLQNAQHCREYLHPPLCPNTDNKSSCREKNDDQHMLWFRHRQKCRDGGQCDLIDSDIMHSNEYEHPEFCRDGGRCENMKDEHLKTYRHVPLCRHRRQCTDYNRRSIEHCQQFRHCIPMCRFGYFCVRFHDEKHMQEEQHPFTHPCPFTPFHCKKYSELCQTKNIKRLSIEIQNHCLNYSHVCRYGRQCRDTSETHWNSTIHVARQACSYGDRCTKTHQEDHLNSFSHPGIADIRLICICDGPDRRKPEHIIQYRHKSHDNSGVIGCFTLSKDIDFVENQENIVKTINDCAKTLSSPSTLSIPSEIQKWIKGLQPVHRCSKVIFESILVHGYVMSREHMEHLKKSKFVAQAVQEHKRVRAILNPHKLPRLEDSVKDYIRAIVSLEYSKKYSGDSTSGSADTSATEENNETIRKQEKALNAIIKSQGVDTIKKCAVDIAEASWNLHHAPTGIGYKPDKALGTDKHIFAVLGPHLGHYYGDIFLVFKSELMLHPDANFSPQAATSFATARTFTFRPWAKDPGSDSERIKCFHGSKLHCSVPGYEYAAAAELMAVTGLPNKTMNVDLKAILNRWKKVDSHQVFEAHLPQLVPLDYVEEVYIPKNLFDSLTPLAQESAKKIFRNSLNITTHEINLSDTGGGGSQPSDKSRSEYQNFVVDKLVRKFEKQIGRTTRFHGTVVTLAPSQFTDHLVIPLTISQAYNQYRRTHKHDPNCDNIFIYWQSLYGDMMITLSDEPIDPQTQQPNMKHLVCYIAERPSTETTSYHETYSYINVGEPLRHILIMKNGHCSASSCSFHRGCNIEDFLTYCLKIEKKIGQVTLSHAGPNSIYCYETIACKFSKTTLDLNALNYIHVSAGAQKVPIRNLVISFEQILDLHPSFDKNFKRGNDPFSGRKRSHSRDRSGSPKQEQSPRAKSPSTIGKFFSDIAKHFGYDPDGKKLKPCPYSINCLFREQSHHTKEYSHPCIYSELCPKKDKEPHLTHEPHHVEQCSSKDSCRKLDDPHHRARYRHKGYPDFLLPCPDGERCGEKSRDHKVKYSHGEKVEIRREKTDNTSDRSSSRSYSDYQGKRSLHEERHDRRIPCRHGSECYEKNDPRHCSKYSHPHECESKTLTGSRDERTSCRYGRDCRDKHDSHHCSIYSHPDERGSKSMASSRDDRTPCRYGRDCRDKHDSHHCSIYSHPDERGSKSMASLRDDRTPCRHGRDCRDKHDSHHCSRYSHPK